MSQNVEVIKSMYAAYAKGDLADIMNHMTDDVQWTSEGVKQMSWAGSWHGKPNTKAFFEGLNKDLESPHLDMNTFIAEGDKVAAFGRYKATVRKTGKHVDTPVAHYFRLKDGKVAEYRNFINSAAVVEAMS